MRTILFGLNNIELKKINNMDLLTSFIRIPFKLILFCLFNCTSWVGNQNLTVYTTSIHCKGLYLIMIWPDIRPTSLPDTGYPAIQILYFYIKNLNLLHFIFLLSFLPIFSIFKKKKVVVIAISRFYFFYTPTGYPAGYYIPKKAGYPVKP